jgi:hypothetical protein
VTPVEERIDHAAVVRAAIEQSYLGHPSAVRRVEAAHVSLDALLTEHSALHSLRWSLGLETHPGEDQQSREDSHRNLDALLDAALPATEPAHPEEPSDG